MFNGIKEKKTILKSAKRSYGPTNDDSKYSIDFVKFKQS
jgi:hypothetical protein